MRKNEGQLDRTPESEPRRHLVIPANPENPALWRNASRYQFIYSLSGLFVGVLSIVGGLVLFLRGVTGSTSWTAKVLGMQSSVSDAAPGAVLFIVGLFIIFVTRFVIKTKTK